jgi:uncharacterized protein (TIGR01244 family)
LATELGWPGINNSFQSERRYFGGQPTAAGLRHAASQGVKTVINLRNDAQADVDYDEAALAAELGMTYLHLPIDSRAFTAADAEAFTKALEGAELPVLVHCRSSNRVGGLWAVHLVSRDLIGPEQALEHGKAAGLKSPATIERTQAVSREVTGP